MTMLVAFAWVGGIVVGGVFGALLMALCVTAQGADDVSPWSVAGRNESSASSAAARAFEDVQQQ